MDTGEMKKGLLRQLATIVAAEHALHQFRGRLADAADEHHGRADQEADFMKARLGLHDHDSEDAQRYDDAVRRRHHAALVGGHLRR